MTATIEPTPDTGAAAPSGSLGSRAARGAGVVYASQIGKIALQVLSVSILARFLDPTAYGYIAIVMTVVTVGEIFRDFGLSAAAIQSPSLSDRQRSTLFWLNTGIGAALALLAVACAPLVAWAFHSPPVTGITRVLALTFLLNGMMSQYRASLIRQLRFGAVAVCDLGAAGVALVVAVTAAVAGWGYWALVTQQLVLAGATTLGLVMAARWLPWNPAPVREVRHMLRFGGHLAGSQIVGYLNANVDTILVGMRFGPSPLGLYNRGYQLLVRPLGQMRTPTTTVAVPVLSRIPAESEQGSRYIVLGQLALGFSIVPFLALCWGAAHPLIDVFLGSGWQSVAPIFAAFAVAGTFETLAFVGNWVYIARGLTDKLFVYTLVMLAIKVVCVLVGSHWGILGVAIGCAVAPAFEWPLSLWWLSRLTPFPVVELWKGAGRILACAAGGGLLAYGISHALRGVPSLLALAAAGLGVLVWYAAVGLAVPSLRRDLLGFVAIAKRARH